MVDFRPKSLRDSDGLELLRAWVMSEFSLEEDDEPVDAWFYPARLMKEIRKAYGAEGLEMPYSNLVEALVVWMLRFHPPEGGVEFLLDAVETSFSKVPPRERQEGPDRDDWRNESTSAHTVWLYIARLHRGYCPEAWIAAHHVRLFRLLRWKDEPGTPVPRSRPTLKRSSWPMRPAARRRPTCSTSSSARSMRNMARIRAEEHLGPEAGRGRLNHPVLPRDRQPMPRAVPGRGAGAGRTPHGRDRRVLAIRSYTGAETFVRLLLALGREAFVAVITPTTRADPASSAT